jgi:hypothetical protein
LKLAPRPWNTLSSPLRRLQPNYRPCCRRLVITSQRIRRPRPPASRNRLNRRDSRNRILVFPLFDCKTRPGRLILSAQNANEPCLPRLQPAACWRQARPASAAGTTGAAAEAAPNPLRASRRPLSRGRSQESRRDSLDHARRACPTLMKPESEQKTIASSQASLGWLLCDLLAAERPTWWRSLIS